MKGMWASRHRSAALLLPLALLACAAAGEPPPSPPQQDEAVSAPAQGLGPESLAGSWRIVEIDGAAPRALREDSGGERRPGITFGGGRYGGTSGCNFFGGLGLLEGGRFYAAPGPQTLIGCGDLSAQEEAITGIFRGGPRVSLARDGRLLIVGDSHRMVLEREAAARGAPQPDEGPPPVLAGTSWTLHALDGTPLRAPGREGGGILHLEADTWSGSAACATLSGSWRQQGDRIIHAGAMATTEQLCPAAEASIDERLAALMAANPRFVTGPNGELLIAGGDHWAIGERSRDGMTNLAGLLAGSWQVAAIDGQPPVAGTSPSLQFGAAGYTGHTGCNHIQGLFLAHRRRLFTHPGPQTEQGCAALAGQEARIAGTLASSPRVALTDDGNIALVDRAGTIRLRRTGPAAVDQVPRAAGLALPLRAGLIAFDGEALRLRATEPESWLRLAGSRWEMRVRCIGLGGVVRRRDGLFHFFTDARPVDAPGCPDAQGELGHRLMRMANGEARAIVGVNGELLVAGDEHWLTGQIESPGARRR